VDQFGRVATVWDNFQAQMDSHEAVISKQVSLSSVFIFHSFWSKTFAPRDIWKTQHEKGLEGQMPML
jgi:hypothetical protein